MASSSPTHKEEIHTKRWLRINNWHPAMSESLMYFTMASCSGSLGRFKKKNGDSLILFTLTGCSESVFHCRTFQNLFAGLVLPISSDVQRLFKWGNSRKPNLTEIGCGKGKQNAHSSLSYEWILPLHTKPAKQQGLTQEPWHNKANSLDCYLYCSPVRQSLSFTTSRSCSLLEISHRHLATMSLDRGMALNFALFVSSSTTTNLPISRSLALSPDLQSPRCWQLKLHGVWGPLLSCVHFNDHLQMWHH